MIFSIWITAISIQVGITILLAIQFFRYKKRTLEDEVSISIVIAAHNELLNLKALIPELLKQTYEKFDVIIALDRCSDGSEEFLDSLDQPKLRVLEITETPIGWDHKKHALTMGIETSTNDWVVLTDADCTPFSTKWLEHLNSRIDLETKIVLGYSPYTSNGSFLQDFIQYEGFITAFNYLSFALLGKPYMGVGRNLGINRSFFMETGGYSEFGSILGGDDDLFIQKNASAHNTRVLIGKESLMTTKPKNNWQDYIHQKTRHLSVGSNYSTVDKVSHLLFNGSLLLSWAPIPLFSWEKVTLIILFYLIVKWIGYRFAHSKMGVGFNYIWLPLVDLMYAIFLPIIAIRSKLVKDIRWKN